MQIVVDIIRLVQRVDEHVRRDACICRFPYSSPCTQCIRRFIVIRRIGCRIATPRSNSLLLRVPSAMTLWHTGRARLGYLGRCAYRHAVQYNAVGVFLCFAFFSVSDMFMSLFVIFCATSFLFHLLPLPPFLLLAAPNDGPVKLGENGADGIWIAVGVCLITR